MVRKRDKRKKKAGIRSARYSSQKLPQIPMVLFGDEQRWVFAAIDAYRAAFFEKHKVPIEAPKAVRLALEEMLQAPKALTPQGKAQGGRRSLGPIRLVAGSEDLLDRIRDVAADKGVNDSDVIRGALAGWLIKRGYGPRKAKK